MKKVLVLYATLEGQTEKIAQALVQKLALHELDVDMLEVSFADCLQMRKYDGVIAGAPVHFSKYPKIFRQFIQHNAMALAERPSAFFSVCLGVLENNQKTQQAERKIVSDFFNQTGWHPPVWTTFAGALKYSRYNWWKRQMMRFIAFRGGGDTDVSRDYEYTSWQAVHQFADDFARSLKEQSVPLEKNVDYSSQEWSPAP